MADLRAQVADLEARLRVQTAATVAVSATAERALARLIEMQPVVTEAILVVDRMTLPPPRLLEAVRRYQDGQA